MFNLHEIARKAATNPTGCWGQKTADHAFFVAVGRAAISHGTTEPMALRAEWYEIETLNEEDQLANEPLLPFRPGLTRVTRAAFGPSIEVVLPRLVRIIPKRVAGMIDGIK